MSKRVQYIEILSNNAMFEHFEMDCEIYFVSLIRANEWIDYTKSDVLSLKKKKKGFNISFEYLKVKTVFIKTSIFVILHKSRLT